MQEGAEIIPPLLEAANPIASGKLSPAKADIKGKDNPQTGSTDIVGEDENGNGDGDGEKESSTPAEFSQQVLELIEKEKPKSSTQKAAELLYTLGEKKTDSDGNIKMDELATYANLVLQLTKKIIDPQYRFIPVSLNLTINGQQITIISECLIEEDGEVKFQTNVGKINVLAILKAQYQIFQQSQENKQKPTTREKPESPQAADQSQQEPEPETPLYGKETRKLVTQLHDRVINQSQQLQPEAATPKTDSELEKAIEETIKENKDRLAQEGYILIESDNLQHLIKSLKTKIEALPDGEKKNQLIERLNAITERQGEAAFVSRAELKELLLLGLDLKRDELIAEATILMQDPFMQNSPEFQQLITQIRSLNPTQLSAALDEGLDYFIQQMNKRPELTQKLIELITQEKPNFQEIFNTVVGQEETDQQIWEKYRKAIKTTSIAFALLILMLIFRSSKDLTGTGGSQAMGH